MSQPCNTYKEQTKGSLEMSTEAKPFSGKENLTTRPGYMVLGSTSKKPVTQLPEFLVQNQQVSHGSPSETGQ